MFAWEERAKPTPSKDAAKRRHAMYTKELAERAALLQRLRFTVERAKQRLRAEVEWDFELHEPPKHAAEVDRIVDAVYRQKPAA